MPFTTENHALLALESSRFDFSIQFEQLFFSIIPSALFIGASIWRTSYQAQKPIVVVAPEFHKVKLVSYPLAYCVEEVN